MICIDIIGGGLAGCEAAWYLANKNFKVNLFEMRPHKMTPAHVTDKLAELVCSNSLKSIHQDTAAGLLKTELKHNNSLIMDIAEKCKVPAGAALAVDREIFSTMITEKITEHPNINVIREEKAIPTTGIITIIACGPLPADSTIKYLLQYTKGALNFIDAISPVISAESVNMEKGYFAGRYGKGGADYLNLPLTKEEFDHFYKELLSAETVKAHPFEDDKVFENCMPIEHIASRGEKTLLFGPMRPVGLDNPNTGERPYAVVQLRQEDIYKTSFNIVGFQTKMTIPEQKKVLRLIPGLENASFLRYGTIHRNTYVNAPQCLTPDQKLIGTEKVYLAGQITGVEGYLESISSGLMAAIQIEAFVKGKNIIDFNINTAFGALQRHIKGDFESKSYTPSNFHFGMLPPAEIKIRKKNERKLFYYERALTELVKNHKQ